MTWAREALKATIPRKSSVSPPETRRRRQDLPSSSDRTMTPCEPELQTTALGARFSLGLWATLTPRRLVFMPRVATSQDCAARPVPVNRKSRRTGKLEALAFLIRLPAPRRLIHEDRAAFHHENDATDRGDVLEGIAVEGNDVGVQAGSQRTDAVPEPERLRDQRIHGFLSAGLHAIEEFFCVAAMGARHGVGPKNDFKPARSDGVAKELLKLRQHLLHGFKRRLGVIADAEIVRFVVEIILKHQAGLRIKISAALG